MNSLAYADIGETSIATTGYLGREPETISSEGVVKSGYRIGRNVIVTTKEDTQNFTWLSPCSLPNYRPPIRRSIYIDCNVLFVLHNSSGIATTGIAFGSESSLEDEGERGVFTLKRRRNILFSQEIELNIAQLPRRKPRVHFDRLAFDIDD